MSGPVSITDLFVVGTALDLVGGYLIARGLLISTPTLVLRSGTFWGGNPSVAVGAVEDRADARIGLAILGTGFTLQALGYVLTLALNPSTSASVERALVALSLAAAAAGAALLIARAVRRKIILRDLVTLARLNVESNDEPPTMDALPPLLELANYARAVAGKRPAETTEQTVARVFGEIETRPPEE